MPERNPQSHKRSFRTNEVCQLTDTQPYVLRFWESEFPQLAPQRRGGQTVYSSQDVDIVMRIKRLLYDEEYTIEGARKRLEQELSGEIEAISPEPIEAPAESAAAPPGPAIELDDADDAPSAESAATGSEVISRERYEDAIEEISHLRLRLREAETAAKKLEAKAQKSEESVKRHRDRAEQARKRLEQLLERLDSPG